MRGAAAVGCDYHLEWRAAFEPSWSPDGRRIVYNTVAPKYPDYDFSPEIIVLDLETGKSTKIGDGYDPAWSPSGEWIAYFQCKVDYKTNRNGWTESLPGPIRLMMVRPDGRDLRTVLTFSKARFLGILFPENRDFWGSIIWSPDSKTILLNQRWNYTEDIRLDTYLLDLTTLRMKRQFRNVPLIFGWVEAK